MAKDIELAILFADVVGSTKLYEQMGDEKARDMVATCDHPATIFLFLCWNNIFDSHPRRANGKSVTTGAGSFIKQSILRARWAAGHASGGPFICAARSNGETRAT